jgi:hypothetical protein
MQGSVDATLAIQRFSARSAAIVRSARVDQKSTSKRLSAQQHGKPHLFAIGKRQFDRPDQPRVQLAVC